MPLLVNWQEIIRSLFDSVDRHLRRILVQPAFHHESNEEDRDNDDTRTRSIPFDAGEISR